MIKASLVKPILVFSLLLGVAACVTVNIYFPAAEVEKVAEEYTDDVYGSLPGVEVKEEKGKDSSEATDGMLKSLLALVAPTPAHAEDATSVNNAVIRELKERNIANLKQLAPFFASRNVGIRNDGLLEVLSTDGLGMKDVSTVKKVVAADNDVRTQLFKEVAAAMGIEASQVGRIQQIFSQEWRDEAPAGWPVQDDSGNWK